MKKLISVLLTICMLVLAMGMAAAEETIYNNGEAPELIKVTEAQNAAAVIKDAQGNVVAAIPDDGQLKIVYVGDRDEATEEIKALLTKSLATLIQDEHIADSASKLETDLFYVEIPEDYAGYLADGGVAEMVFKPLIMQDVSELLVLTTVDGETWTEAPSVAFNGDGTVTVGVNGNCVVAFVITHGDFITVYGNKTTIEEDVEDETNPNFTPSVTGKPDPELVEVEVEDETGIAVVIDPEGEVVELLTDRNKIIVTPLFERVYNPDVVTYEHLQWAYDTICTAPDLGGLTNVDGEGTLGEEIDRRLEGTGLDRMDMTVSDLFEVTVYGDYQQLLQNGNRLEVTLDRTFRQDEVLMVLCAIDIENWHVVEDQYVTINADGTLTLSLEHQGVFALLVERLDADMDAEGAVMAP